MINLPGSEYWLDAAGSLAVAFVWVSTSAT